MDLRAHLLATLDRAYDVTSWHGPNLKGSLRGLSPAVAFFRPGPKRHSIYDLVLHAAYWKYVVRRRLTGEKRGSFALEGSNFFPAPSRPSARALADAKLAPRSTSTGRSARSWRICPRPRSGRASGAGRRRPSISGVAAHDLYHAGQIQLLKRLYAERRRG